MRRLEVKRMEGVGPSGLRVNGNLKVWWDRTATANPRPRFKKRTWGTLRVFLIYGQLGVSVFDQGEFGGFTIESFGPPAGRRNHFVENSHA
jgi:hypothetical protein